VPEPILLSATARKELRRHSRRVLGRVAERIQYVLLFARGYDVSEIAAQYEIDVRTVTTWLERFRTDGVGALDDLPRSGRPRAASVVAQIEARHCLEATPDYVGLLRSTWTRRLLRWHLGTRLQCWLSPRSVGRLIHRLGFVWTRPKLITRGDDPEAAPRKTAIAALITAHPTAPRVYEDECDVHQVPVLRGQYQRKGTQREIPTPGINRKQAVFGFLNVLTGEWYFWLTGRKRSVEFLACLHELYRRWPTGPILLFLDNASIHKSKVTRRWLANHPRYLVAYLPAYSGHETNPVEKVWWELKGEQFANEMYPSLEAIQDAICAFFASFSRERALRLTARHERELQTAELARAA
jgi:transposase